MTDFIKMLLDATKRNPTINRNDYRDVLLGRDSPSLPTPVTPLEAVRTSMSKLHTQLNPPRDIRSSKSVMQMLMGATRINAMTNGDDREAFGRDVRKSGLDALEIRRMGAFMGIPIHVVPDDIARITVPVKEHKSGIGRRGNYHNRIQKKWNKRYGFKTVDRVYFMDQPRFTQDGNAYFGPTKAQKVMVVGETYFQRIQQEARDLGVL